MNERERKEILEEHVKIAEMGRQVMGNEAFKQAFTARQARIFDEFCSSSAADQSVRDEAWRSMQNLLALKEYFEQTLTTGKMAFEELKSMKH